MYFFEYKKQSGATLILVSVICSIILLSSLIYLQRAREVLQMTQRFFNIEQAFLAADAGLHYCEKELMDSINILPPNQLSLFSKNAEKTLINFKIDTQTKLFSHNKISHSIIFDEKNRAGHADCHYQQTITHQNANQSFEINSTGYSTFSQATATVRLTIDVIEGEIFKRWQLVNFL